MVGHKQPVRGPPVRELQVLQSSCSDDRGERVAGTILFDSPSPAVVESVPAGEGSAHLPSSRQHSNCAPLASDVGDCSCFQQHRGTSLAGADIVCRSDGASIPVRAFQPRLVEKSRPPTSRGPAMLGDPARQLSGLSHTGEGGGREGDERLAKARLRNDTCDRSLVLAWRGDRISRWPCSRGKSCLILDVCTRIATSLATCNAQRRVVLVALSGRNNDGPRRASPALRRRRDWDVDSIAA